MLGSIVRLATAAAVLALATTAQAQTSPISGTWAGTASQDSPGTAYPLRLTIDGTRGTIEYGGTANCRGTLEAVRGQRDVYLERITVNRYDMNARYPTGCIDGGTVTLTRTPNGRVTFHWLMDWGNDRIESRGELSAAH